MFFYRSRSLTIVSLEYLVPPCWWLGCDNVRIEMTYTNEDIRCVDALLSYGVMLMVVDCFMFDRVDVTRVIFFHSFYCIYGYREKGLRLLGWDTCLYVCC